MRPPTTSNGRAVSDLLGRVTALLGSNPERLIHRVRELNAAHDRQKAGVEHLEHMRKVVLSQEMERIRSEASERMTVQELENRARVSPAYREHLRELRAEKEVLADMAAAYYGARNALEWAERMLSFAQTEAKLTR
jgi:hypothetical protein